MKQNYKLVLSYDGTRYRGWQRLGNTDNTIQRKVETALSRLLEQEVEICASGRTDAGVHARRQLCTFQAETALPCGNILRSLRQVLPQDIGAVALTEAPPRFHARYSCISKTYVYRIWTSETPNVFERDYLFPYSQPLDLSAMRAAATHLCGEHDFSAFTNAKMKKSAIRRIDSIGFEQIGGELRMTFQGSGFLYNMVRILVGTLLEVGIGQRAAEEIPAIIASHKRENAGFLAPAKGLILWDEECTAENAEGGCTVPVRKHPD